MNEDKKYSLQEKMDMAVEALSKELGKLTNEIDIEKSLREYFPDEGNDNDFTGLPNMLEFLVNLEMQILNGTFRLSPDVFMKEDITLKEFIEELHKAEETEDDKSYESIKDNLKDLKDEDDIDEETEDESEDVDMDEELAMA